MSLCSIPIFTKKPSSKQAKQTQQAQQAQQSQQAHQFNNRSKHSKHSKHSRHNKPTVRLVAGSRLDEICWLPGLLANRQ